MAAEYRFTAPAPNTHRRILLRRGRTGLSLADIFGLNLPFDSGRVEPKLLGTMRAAGILASRHGRLRSTVRIASVHDHLFLHSGFPVRDEDHVFLGPDSYRFAEFIRAELGAPAPGARILDVGAGAGVGGVMAAHRLSGPQLVLADINPHALRLARVNARCAGLTPQLRLGDGVPTDTAPFDIIVMNPPYILGSGRTYSDGGGALGGELTLRWVEAALARLNPGGRVLAYSGSAIVQGHDALREALLRIAQRSDCRLTYRELDPDVFPATLLQPRYWRVERIAAIGAVLTWDAG